MKLRCCDVAELDKVEKELKAKVYDTFCSACKFSWSRCLRIKEANPCTGNAGVMSHIASLVQPTDNRTRRPNSRFVEAARDDDHNKVNQKRKHALRLHHRRQKLKLRKLDRLQESRRHDIVEKHKRDITVSQQKERIDELLLKTERLND